MFIKLTDTENKGVATYINPDSIMSFFDLGNGATRIYEAHGEHICDAEETPEQILALIEAERAKGLRDELAQREDLRDWEAITYGTCLSLTGRDRPTGILERLQWEVEWKAKLRYIWADAMLRAREA